MSGATLVYDDDCGFCTWWAQYLDANSDLRLVGFSELDSDLRARLPADYEQCSHLVTDDEVYSCGASIEEAVRRSDLGDSASPAIEIARRFGPYRRAREGVYRWVADNRDLLGRVISTTPARRQSNRGE
ncbi:MAG: thiol-disulfide oxidoreductase DCC family protein [Haloarculaceae archaeon]